MSDNAIGGVVTLAVLTFVLTVVLCVWHSSEKDTDAEINANQVILNCAVKTGNPFACRVAIKGMR